MPQIVALPSLHACWPHQPASMSSLWNWPVALSGSLALESHNVAPHSVGAPSVTKRAHKRNPGLRAEGPPCWPIRPIVLLVLVDSLVCVPWREAPHFCARNRAPSQFRRTVSRSRPSLAYRARLLLINASILRVI